MDKSALEKFERNIGKPKVVKIGEDEFEFVSLPFENLIEFFGLSEAIEEQSKNKSSKLPLEAIKTIMRLEKIMVKESYPELDDKKAEAFVKKYIFALMPVLMELNSPGTDGLDDKQKKALDDFKKKMESQNDKA